MARELLAALGYRFSLPQPGVGVARENLRVERGLGLANYASIAFYFIPDPRTNEPPTPH